VKRRRFKNRRRILPLPLLDVLILNDPKPSKKRFDWIHRYVFFTLSCQLIRCTVHRWRNNIWCCHRWSIFCKCRRRIRSWRLF
jgi:hypothetical protein